MILHGFYQNSPDVAIAYSQPNLEPDLSINSTNEVNISNESESERNISENSSYSETGVFIDERV